MLEAQTFFISAQSGVSATQTLNCFRCFARSQLFSLCEVNTLTAIRYVFFFLILSFHCWDRHSNMIAGSHAHNCNRLNNWTFARFINVRNSLLNLLVFFRLAFLYCAIAHHILYKTLTHTVRKTSPTAENEK